MCTIAELSMQEWDDLNEQAKSRLLLRAVKAVHRELRQLNIGMEQLMAQIDDLMSTLQAIGTDVGQKAQEMLDLEQKLTDLQNSTPASVDLQPAIDLATSIRQSLEGTAQQASSATSDAGSGGVAADTGTSDLGVAGTGDPGVADTGTSTPPDSGVATPAPDPSSAAGVSDGSAGSGFGDGTDGSVPQSDTPST